MISIPFLSSIPSYPRRLPTKRTRNGNKKRALRGLTNASSPQPLKGLGSPEYGSANSPWKLSQPLRWAVSWRSWTPTEASLHQTLREPGIRWTQGCIFLVLASSLGLHCPDDPHSNHSTTPACQIERLEKAKHQLAGLPGELLGVYVRP